MNDMLVPTDERKVPTEWPRRLYLPPPQYFHTSHRRDAVEVRAQALERYRKTPPRGLQPCAVGKLRTPNTSAYWLIAHRCAKSILITCFGDHCFTVEYAACALRRANYARKTVRN